MKYSYIVKYFLVVTALFSAFGLIITNMHLARYYICDYNILRSQTVLFGFVFFLITVSLVVFYLFMLDTEKMESFPVMYLLLHLVVKCILLTNTTYQIITFSLVKSCTGTLMFFGSLLPVETVALISGLTSIAIFLSFLFLKTQYTTDKLSSFEKSISRILFTVVIIVSMFFGVLLLVSQHDYRSIFKYVASVGFFVFALLLRKTNFLDDKDEGLALFSKDPTEQSWKYVVLSVSFAAFTLYFFLSTYSETVFP